MSNKQKLELTWIGKDQRPRLEPRILIEDKNLSYRAEAPTPAQGDLLTEAVSPAFQVGEVKKPADPKVQAVQFFPNPKLKKPQAAELGEPWQAMPPRRG